MNNFTYILAGTLLIAGWWYLYKKFSKAPSNIYDSFPKKEVEILTFEEIVKFFKSEEMNIELKNNKDIIAVAINTNENKDGFNSFFVGTFDKVKNCVKKGVVFDCKDVDEIIKKQFGDKRMIILR